MAGIAWIVASSGIDQLRFTLHVNLQKEIIPDPSIILLEHLSAHVIWLGKVRRGMICTFEGTRMIFVAYPPFLFCSSIVATQSPAAGTKFLPKNGFKIAPIHGDCSPLGPSPLLARYRLPAT